MSTYRKALKNKAGGVVSRQSMLSKWKHERGCYKISLLCVGHETKHGFRPVVRLAIGDEGSPGCSIKLNLITELLFDLAVVFDDEG